MSWRSGCPSDVALSRGYSTHEPKVQAHASSCPSCGAKLRSFERLSELSRELVVAQPSAERVERVRSNLRRAVRLAAPARARRSFGWRAGWAAVAFAATAGAAVAVARAPLLFRDAPAVAITADPVIARLPAQTPAPPAAAPEVSPPPPEGTAAPEPKPLPEQAPFARPPAAERTPSPSTMAEPPVAPARPASAEPSAPSEAPVPAPAAAPAAGTTGTLEAPPPATSADADAGKGEPGADGRDDKKQERREEKAERRQERKQERRQDREDRKLDRHMR